MTDLIHISFNNDVVTFGIALNKKPKNKFLKTKLTDLVSSSLVDKSHFRYKIKRFKVGPLTFYWIKENELVKSYVDQIKRMDSAKGWIKTEKQVTTDIIVQKLSDALEKIDNERLDKDVLQEWISCLKTKKEPPSDFVQKVGKWNKLVEEKNQIYGGTKFVPFEL